jgi:uncharacterized protein YegL
MKMKKDLVEMVFILDRSGSMEGLEKDTIGGFNSMINKQKKIPGEALVSTVLFDDAYEVLHNRKSIKEVPSLTHEEYFVRGSTALLDAIGRSLKKMISVYRKLKDEEKPEKTIFVITTDGMENASREFTSTQIKQMIEKQKEKYQWEFIFLGANIDAVRTARDFGIRKDRVANYHSDEQGTALNYEAISDAIYELRVNRCINPDWNDEINKDFNSRKK